MSQYACSRASDAICKFLVESGCDVDRIEAIPNCEEDRRRRTPLAGFLSIDKVVYGHIFERSLMCRKYLLQAGADPLVGTMDIDSQSEPKSVIEDALGVLQGRRRLAVL